MTEERRDDVVYRTHEILSSTTFLKYAFLRWVLSPAVRPEIYRFVTPQKGVAVGSSRYLVDYEIAGSEKTFVVELDGYGPHGGGQPSAMIGCVRTICTPRDASWRASLTTRSVRRPYGAFISSRSSS